MSLSGHLALVTGGASGIGEAVCHSLAAEGATLIVADKQLDGARKVAQSLPGNANHQAMQVDVGDSSSVEQLFASVKINFQRPPSTVVNCAGILRLGLIFECSDEVFDDIMRVNLKGTFTVTRAASREMINAPDTLPSGGGAIVNVASILAKSGYCAYAAYSASKAGVVALTKTAAKELAAHGIRCNAVLPGMTDTAMTASAPADVRASALSAIPLKRSAQPREIAETIKFLCCPATASFITGAAVDVSGGYGI
ncbi:hypothetical protein HPB48_007404 [Haemaphysalis longicornis]|uniref:(3R)-3-hydroxyacyl-CoA dehydrogenase n=1 Tax=Haemaphysalis longicornis TaxID=44386 RepID=A0A9J6G5B0_HAELO|nr:hypothetical protein HPB48_007404 [Haemaphysalis longicornis]